MVREVLIVNEDLTLELLTREIKTLEDRLESLKEQLYEADIYQIEMIRRNNNWVNLSKSLEKGSVVAVSK